MDSAGLPKAHLELSLSVLSDDAIDSSDRCNHDIARFDICLFLFFSSGVACPFKNTRSWHMHVVYLYIHFYLQAYSCVLVLQQSFGTVV
jgi:hypothetical protein